MNLWFASVGSPQSFYGLVIDHLWQSTLFALLVLGILGLMRNSPARVRYLLYLSISLKFLLPAPLLIHLVKRIGFDASAFWISLAWTTHDPAGFVTHQMGAFHVAEVLPLGSNFRIAATFIWFIGCMVVFCMWLAQHLRLQREIDRGYRIKEGREFEILSGLITQFKIHRTIGLATSSEFLEVGVQGSFRPVILLPQDMAAHLSDSELKAILTHELVHVARWDNLASSIQMVICCLFWFHPMVWIVERKMLAERERVCDDRVIEMGSASRIYATSLIKVLRFGLGFRMAGVSCAGGSNLKRRIQQITAGTSSPKRSWIHQLVIGGVIAALLVLSVAAVTIEKCEVEPLLKKASVKEPC